MASAKMREGRCPVLFVYGVLREFAQIWRPCCLCGLWRADVARFGCALGIYGFCGSGCPVIIRAGSFRKEHRHEYSVQNHSQCYWGRDGKAELTDGTLEFRLATPTELCGTGGDGNNPEQIFACGYSACYPGALKYVARKEKVKIADDARVTATVGIGLRDDGEGFGIDVDLEVSLPRLERPQAEELVKKAHLICPCSHATRGNIDVRTAIA